MISESQLTTSRNCGPHRKGGMSEESEQQESHSQSQQKVFDKIEKKTEAGCEHNLSRQPQSLMDKSDEEMEVSEDMTAGKNTNRLEGQMEGSVTNEGLNSDFLLESQNKFVNRLIQNLEMKNQMTS